MRETLSYLDPTSTRNRLHVTPGERCTTTTYDPRSVFIADARPHRAELDLGAAGLARLDHDSAVADLGGDEEVERVYVPEACETIRLLTGADVVVALGWVRRSSSRGTPGAQPPAADVHVDVHPDRAPGRFADVHARAAPAVPPFRRAIFSSLWRCLSPPPQDWPLALCDHRRVEDDEAVPNLMLNVEALPDKDI